MALNIPNTDLPGNSFLKGLNTGSSMFSRLMQPIIQREQLAEQGRYHQGQLTHQERALQEQMKQHQQNYALKQMMEQRRAALAPLQQQVEQLRIQNLKNKADPNFKMNQFKAIADSMGGMNPETFKKNPLLRGLYKKEFGIDPLQQSPEEKLQSDIDKSLAIDAGKADRKEITEIKETVTPVLEAANHIKELEKIFKEHPNRTGALAGRFSNAPLLNKFYDNATIKAINAHAVPLQGQIAAQLSKRGGYGVAKIAESAKPSVTDTHEGNLASLKANKQAVIESFKQLKDRYESINKGKKFPYKLPEFMKDDEPEQVTAKSAEPKKRIKFNITSGRLE